MSSLAYYGSPIDYDNTLMNNKTNNTLSKTTNHDDTNIIHKKRNNKTQKNISSSLSSSTTITEPFYSEKVNNVLNTLQNLPNNDDNESEYDEDNNYKPLIPNPISSGVEKTKYNENILKQQQKEEQHNFMYQQQQQLQPPSLKNIPFPLLNQNDNDPHIYKNNYYSPSFNNQDSNSVFIQKLNYMIHLLEEKQDQKTNNVFEEVILYSFLGIFIIFLVDSFSNLGSKYRR